MSERIQFNTEDEVKYFSDDDHSATESDHSFQSLSDVSDDDDDLLNQPIAALKYVTATNSHRVGAINLEDYDGLEDDFPLQDRGLHDLTHKQQILSNGFDYYDEINNKNYSLFEIIKIKRDKSNAELIARTKGQLVKKRDTLVLGTYAPVYHLNPPPPGTNIPPSISNLTETVAADVIGKLQVNVKMGNTHVDKHLVVFPQPVPMPILSLETRPITETQVIRPTEEDLADDPTAIPTLEVNKTNVKIEAFNISPGTAETPPVYTGGVWTASYCPHYKTTPYWKHVMIELRNMLAMSYYEPMHRELENLYHDLNKLTHLNYFGIRWEGQVKRLKDVLKVHLETKGKASPYSIRAIVSNYLQKTREDSDSTLNSLAKEVRVGIDSVVHYDFGSVKSTEQCYTYLATLAEISRTDFTFEKMYDDYNRALDTIFPIPQLLITPDFSNTKRPSIFDLENQWMAQWFVPEFNSFIPFNLISLNPQSNAGVLFMSRNPKSTATNELPRVERTHADVIASEVALAQRFLSTIHIVAQNMKTSNKYNMDLVYNAFNFLWVSLYKPKAEVYEIPGAEFNGERNDMNTKTRNICATNVCAFLPGMPITSVTHKVAPCYHESPQSRILLGFSPFKGGADRLIRMMLASSVVYDQPGKIKIHTLTYSDNLYIYGIYYNVNTNTSTLMWRSLDGVKMEGAITLDDVYLENQRKISKLQTNSQHRPQDDDDSKTNSHSKFIPVSPAFVQYACSIEPSLMTRQKGLLGKTQFQVPGMASGSVGTGYTNTAKMGGLAASLDGKIISLDEFPQSTEKLGAVREPCDIYRLQLTVECVTDLDLGSSRRPSDMYDHLVRSNTGKTIAFDLLGYDIFFIDDLATRAAMYDNEADLLNDDHPRVPLIMPCLDKKRLLKSLMFHKFTYYMKKKDQEEFPLEMRNAMQILLLRVLYLIGGYAYPELSTLIRHMINVLMTEAGFNNNTAENKQNLDAIVDHLISTLEEENGLTSILSTLKHEFSSLGIPSFDSLLSLHGYPIGVPSTCGTITPNLLRQFLLKYYFQNNHSLGPRIDDTDALKDYSFEARVKVYKQKAKDNPSSMINRRINTELGQMQLYFLEIYHKLIFKPKILIYFATKYVETFRNAGYKITLLNSYEDDEPYVMESTRMVVSDINSDVELDSSASFKLHDLNDESLMMHEVQREADNVSISNITVNTNGDNVSAIASRTSNKKGQVKPLSKVPMILTDTTYKFQKQKLEESSFTNQVIMSALQTLSNGRGNDKELLKRKDDALYESQTNDSIAEGQNLRDYLIFVSTTNSGLLSLYLHDTEPEAWKDFHVAFTRKVTTFVTERILAYLIEYIQVPEIKNRLDYPTVQKELKRYLEINKDKPMPYRKFPFRFELKESRDKVHLIYEGDVMLNGITDGYSFVLGFAKDIKIYKLKTQDIKVNLLRQYKKVEKGIRKDKAQAKKSQRKAQKHGEKIAID
jgi:hypothetical protein